MKLDGFTKYMRNSGCRVRIYKNLWEVKGSTGYFDVNSKGPYICAAINGLTPIYQMELLAHEYGHYLQWMEEKDLDVEEVEMYKIQEDWIARKNEFTPEILKEARDFMLYYEWDADRRAAELSSKLNLEPWDTPSFLRGTQSYINSIKWSWLARKNFSVSASRWHFKPKPMTEEEVLEPLTIEAFRKIDKWVRAVNR